MENSKLLNGFILILLPIGVSSCTAITGIFNIGMGYGIFIVLAVLVLIIGVIMKLSKK